MKLQLLNDLGIPFDLSGASTVELVLPYHRGELRKAVDILDIETGMIKAALTDFEIQGLKDGTGQTFWVSVKRENKLFTFEFSKTLNVTIKDGRKVIE